MKREKKIMKNNHVLLKLSTKILKIILVTAAQIQLEQPTKNASTHFSLRQLCPGICSGGS
jgi:hypothetical protein